MRSILSRLHGFSRARLQISPDCDYVMLSGHGAEARGQMLRGKLILRVAKGESIKGVDLCLRRYVKLGHSGNSSQIEHVHRWDHFMVPDNPNRSDRYSHIYEWPFEVWISGDQIETFKACDLCSLTYRLEASALDEGPENEECRTSVPIRISRQFSLSSYELMDPVASCGVWEDQVEYGVAVRHRAAPLGGLIPIDVKLTALGTDVKVTKARFYLEETHIVSNSGESGHVSEYMQRPVEEWWLKIEEQSQGTHVWQQYLHLPRIVRKASPDFSFQGTTIAHTLHFAVTLSRDGVEKELETSMDVILFVSPELPISGWDIFVYDEKNVTEDHFHALAGGIGVPPKYSEGVNHLHALARSVSDPPKYSEGVNHLHALARGVSDPPKYSEGEKGLVREVTMLPRVAPPPYTQC